MGLVSHPGWVRVKELLDQQCRLRRMEVFGLRPTGMDDCFKIAGIQGEVAGLQFVSRLVETILDDTQMQIHERLAEERINQVMDK